MATVNVSTVNQLREALKGQNVINLAEGTYIIDYPDSLIINSNTKLLGAGIDRTIIKIGKRGWKGEQSAIMVTNAKEITIAAITFDGSFHDSDGSHGKGLDGLFRFSNCRGIIFDMCRFKDNRSDFIKARNSTNFLFTNILFSNAGHEFFYSLSTTNCSFINCYGTIRTNNFVRMSYASSLFMIKDCIVDTEAFSVKLTDGKTYYIEGLNGTAACEMIQADTNSASVDGIKISNCIFRNNRGCAIRFYSSSNRAGKNLITNCKFENIATTPESWRWSVSAIHINRAAVEISNCEFNNCGDKPKKLALTTVDPYPDDSKPTGGSFKIKFIENTGDSLGVDNVDRRVHIIEKTGSAAPIENSTPVAAEAGNNTIKVTGTTTGVAYTAYNTSGTIPQGSKIVYSLGGAERVIYTTETDMLSGSLSGEVLIDNLKKYFPAYTTTTPVRVTILGPGQTTPDVVTPPKPTEPPAPIEEPPAVSASGLWSKYEPTVLNNRKATAEALTKITQGQDMQTTIVELSIGEKSTRLILTLDLGLQVEENATPDLNIRVKQLLSNGATAELKGIVKTEFKD